ncbi:MAG: TIGR00341 family protein [Methanospirillum sp.]|nr:TIGR00341 family protein [Methanospirillum sp.]
MRDIVKEPSEWVTKNRFDPMYLSVMVEKLFFEGENRIREITNYVALLTLATIIATYGVISGSAATVIGAMIVAPLMTPIMATTLAIVLGNGRRMVRSILIVVLSVAYVIGLSALLSLFISELVIDFGSNTEILGRVSPNIIALYAALASGAAGAFAVSREEIAEALPGVAIAVSLAPPLCVVGICLAHSRWLDGFGALILFLTNFFAIVLAGGGVFLLSGIHSRLKGSEEVHLRRQAIAITVVGTLVVTAILGVNGYRTLEIDRGSTTALETAADWLSETEYTVEGVVLTYSPGDLLVRGPVRVRLRISGKGTIPPLEELVEDLEARLGYRVLLEVRAIPEEIQYYPASIVRPLLGNETDPFDNILGGFLNVPGDFSQGVKSEATSVAYRRVAIH